MFLLPPKKKKNLNQIGIMRSNAQQSRFRQLTLNTITPRFDSPIIIIIILPISALQRQRLNPHTGMEDDA